MFSFKNIMILAAAAAVVCGGCQDQGTRKNAARAKWERASEQVKLPIAQQQFAEGKYQEAYTTVNEILSADKTSGEAHLLAGKILIAEGLGRKGIEEVNTAVKCNPRLAEGYHLLGTAAEERRDMAEAAKLYKQACAIEPGNVTYFTAQIDLLSQMNDFRTAADMLEKEIAAAPDNWHFKALYARLLQYQGRIDDAIGYYRQACMIAGRNDELSESLGYCYILAGKWSEAAEIFEELAKTCPDEQCRQNMLTIIAQCNLNARQFNRAIADLDKLSVSERDNAQVWLRLGQAALASGSTQRAYTCSQRALKLNPGYTDAIMLEGCSQYANRNYYSAAQSFEKIVDDVKEGPFAMLMLGKCYEKQGDAARAKAAFERARAGSDGEVSQYLAKLIK
jgi:tetratricopeptide (TPR) repeat protein